MTLAVAIRQLMVFLIDLSEAYLSVVAVIAPEGQERWCPPANFPSFPQITCPIFIAPSS